MTGRAGALLGALAFLGSAPADAADTDAEIVTYEVDLQHATDLAGVGGLAVGFKGTMAVARLPGSPARLRLDLGAMRAQAKKGGKGGVEQPAVFHGLDQPVLLELDKSGLPSRLAFSPAADAGARQLVEYLVAEMQVQPARGGRSSWRATERDATGTYRAEYSRGPGASEIRKIKRTYDTQPGRPSVVVVSSDHRFVLSPKGVVTAVSGSERLRVPQVNSETTSTISVKLVASVRRALPAAEAAPAPNAVWFEFGSAHSPTQKEKDDALLAGVTRGQALERLRTTTGGELFRAIGVAAAFTRRDPAMLPALEREADSGQSPLPRIIAVLMAAETDAAEAVLARWLTSSGDRARAVSEELLIRRPPSPPLVAALVKLATNRSDTRDLWRRATFALGTAASLLRPTQPEQARELTARLLAFEEASGGENPVVFIGALANTRDPAILPRLRARLSSREPNVATEAALALGPLELAPVTALLDETATRSSTPAVRAAALRACGRRPVGFRCASPARAARKDLDASVRRAALDATADDNEVRRGLLVKMSASDPDPNLRQYAAKQLSAPPAPASDASALRWRAR